MQAAPFDNTFSSKNVSVNQLLLDRKILPVTVEQRAIYVIKPLPSPFYSTHFTYVLAYTYMHVPRWCELPQLSFSSDFSLRVFMHSNTHERVRFAFSAFSFFFFLSLAFGGEVLFFCFVYICDVLLNKLKIQRISKMQRLAGDKSFGVHIYVREINGRSAGMNGFESCSHKCYP